MPWTDPEVEITSCNKGERVTLIKQANVMRAGGREKCRIWHRTIICSQTTDAGIKFQVGHRPPRLCEDCNLTN